MELTDEDFEELKRYSITIACSPSESGCVIADSRTGTSRVCHFSVYQWQIVDWPDDLPLFIRDEAESEITIRLARMGGIRA